MTSAAVAEVGYRACMRGRRIVVAGVFNKMLVAGSKFIPRSWATFIGRLMTQPVGAKKLGRQS
jgi:short-subunit dehydrogenase